MGASRTLLRKLDLDLIARIEASGKPEKPKKTSRKKIARPWWAYRAAWRNCRRTMQLDRLAQKRAGANHA